MRIAVASGKGGTGKTFLSTNLFTRMKQSGLRVAMVDCDAEVPNASLFLEGKVVEQKPVEVLCPKIDLEKCTRCGICADGCAYHAITCIEGMNYIKLIENLCHGCGACLVECPQKAVVKAYKTIGQVSKIDLGAGYYLYEARTMEGVHSPVEVIRHALTEAEKQKADYLILDAPPGCSCPFVNTVDQADFVVLVTEPTPFGLSDLRHTVEVLRHLERPFGVVINRADLGSDQMRQWLREERIPLLLEIPYSEQVASVYARGGLVVSADRNFAALFDELLKRITAYESSNY